LSLKDYRESIKRAYYATSFDPDGKADRIIEDFTPEYESMDTEQKKEKYLKYFLAWMNAESRCMSSMITDPANFPVARNRKKMEWAYSAYEKFRKFVEKINHVRVKTLSPEEDLEAMLKKHETLRSNHEIMKSVNKIWRSKTKNKVLEISKLLEIPEDEAKKMRGYQQFELSNNLAKIKTVEQRIIDLKKRIEAKESFQVINFQGGMIDIVDDRVRISHDEKPPAEIIEKLKSKGFWYSWKYNTWNRKHTARAISDAKIICCTPMK
jgi:hypothetical protein